jgi:hypothetical protein
MKASTPYVSVATARQEVEHAAFLERPLALIEKPEQEQERIQRLKREDPITLQDAVNTSRALVDAVKEADVEEMRRVVADAVEGEFLQVFVMQAFVLALKSGSLAMVKEMVNWGVPLHHAELAEAVHVVCEITNRDNFSDTWRIVQLLTEGNGEGKIDINTPRRADGWTPLCVACADACLPLVFKLLELDADPNAITRANATPLGIAKIKRAAIDDEEQQEARSIITNMLRHYGGEENWKAALRKPKIKMPPQEEVTVETEDGDTIVQQAVSKNTTRFCG